MSILKNVQQAVVAVQDDNIHGNPNAIPPTPAGALGKKLSDAAVAAITNGIKSDAGKRYMSLFANNAKQLERLTVENPNGNPDPSYLPLMRAYILANSVCDIGTNTGLARNIDERIDKNPTLPENSDGTCAPLRPFSIPGIEG